MALYNAQPISRHEVGPLLVQPVERQSLAFLTATIVRTDAYDFRIPIVSADPTAAWVNEGQDIPITDPALAEVTVTPQKVAGLVVVSRELAMDSTPDAANVVGAGLARDIARRVDAAFFGALLAPAPSGLGALSGIQTAVGAFTKRHLCGPTCVSRLVQREDARAGALPRHFPADPRTADETDMRTSHAATALAAFTAGLIAAATLRRLAGHRLPVTAAVTVGVHGLLGGAGGRGP